jgi:tetratricopeptide (TPR) repeat protein
VEYAQKALELAGGDDYQYMDTLAAAYAEMGRFDEATALQEKALSRLPSDAGTEERADLEQRLDLYKKRKPFHEK